MTPPPMQFSFVDLIGPVIVILILAGFEGAQSFGTAKIKATAAGWYLRMLVVHAITFLPFWIVWSAISRADAADLDSRVSIWTHAGWGVAASALAWVIIGSIAPVRRWLREPSRKAREFERKSVA